MQDVFVKQEIDLTIEIMKENAVRMTKCLDHIHKFLGIVQIANRDRELYPETDFPELFARVHFMHDFWSDALRECENQLRVGLAIQARHAVE